MVYATVNFICLQAVLREELAAESHFLGEGHTKAAEEVRKGHHKTRKVWIDLLILGSCAARRGTDHLLEASSSCRSTSSSLECHGSSKAVRIASLQRSAASVPRDATTPASDCNQF